MITGLEDLEYEERLRRLKLHSLYYRRLRGDLILVYQYHTGLVKCDNVEELFPPAITTSTRGHDLRLQKSRSKHKVRYNFFTQRIVNHWNSLPAEIIHARSIGIFKSKLDTHLSHLHYTTTAPPRN